MLLGHPKADAELGVPRVLKRRHGEVVVDTVKDSTIGGGAHAAMEGHLVAVARFVRRRVGPDELDVQAQRGTACAPTIAAARLSLAAACGGDDSGDAPLWQLAQHASSESLPPTA